ncbi:hypothetical protein [Bradyrhizobium sp. USDA 10063]
MRQRCHRYAPQIVIAHTAPQFADLPPLWKLGLNACSSQAQP